MPIIAPIPCNERRLMQKTIHNTRDKHHARRLTAMLMLHRGRPSQRCRQNTLLHPFFRQPLDKLVYPLWY
ncbi:hypothetical protein QAB11_028245 [Klebsiella pneumoniae]|nr:hypothetical protein [Klebsiella pneumoniae]MDU3714924.1 hypothetical protein [Klebsiella michiganensis]MEC5980540.1 hypothetical protein [Klebsiella pneumoniae]